MKSVFDKSQSMFRPLLGSRFKPICLLLVASMLCFAVNAEDSLAREKTGRSEFSEIVEVARQFGSADLIKASDDDPYLDGKINGIFYSGLLRDCDDDKSSCGSLTLRAIYELDTPPLQKVNDFNVTTKVGKLYLLEDKLVFDYFLSLEGGLRRENLHSCFEWFILGLEDLDTAFTAKHSLSRTLLDKLREKLH